MRLPSGDQTGSAKQPVPVVSLRCCAPVELISQIRELPSRKLWNAISPFWPGTPRANGAAPAASAAVATATASEPSIQRVPLAAAALLLCGRRLRLLLRVVLGVVLAFELRRLREQLVRDLPQLLHRLLREEADERRDRGETERARLLDLRRGREEPGAEDEVEDRAAERADDG